MTAIHRSLVEVTEAPVVIDTTRVLSVAPARNSGEFVDIWFVANERGQIGQTTVDIYGTGHPLVDDPGEFIGTCVMPSQLVWHVFARRLVGPSD